MPNPNPIQTQAVAAENVVYSYGTRRALDQVSFSVAADEFIAILGPNGGGKTTLFRIIATLATAAEGRVLVFGDDVRADRARVRHHLGVVFQAPALDVKLTLRENLLHHGHLHGLSGKPLRQAIDASLEQLDISDRRRDLVESLSGGLRRRAELAKVMLTHPRLLLLDEPTTGLDPIAREAFWRIISDLRAQTQCAVLCTTHLLEEAEACDRVVILDKGRIVADGDPVQLRTQISGQVVRLKGHKPDLIKARMKEQFGLDGEIDGEHVRVVVEDGGGFAARAGQAFGDLIDSLEVARPSLYDVFRQRTGHAFANGDEG
jgi:ABC-2 type transport system ATP-binding protein